MAFIPGFVRVTMVDFGLHKMLSVSTIIIMWMFKVHVFSCVHSGRYVEYNSTEIFNSDKVLYVFFFLTKKYSCKLLRHTRISLITKIRIFLENINY